MTQTPIIINGEPDPADTRYIEEQIYTYNTKKTGFEFGGSVAAFIKNEAGEILAGITGFCWGFTLKIELLWVREDQRGQALGTKLLQAAEEEGKRRGCKQVFLETHSFQAPGFYEKMGYTVFGVLDDFPMGYSQLYLRKSLV